MISFEVLNKPGAQPRTYAYTIYSAWFGGLDQANAGMRELAEKTAKERSWRVAGITMTPDGFDSRGDRFIAVVDYRPGSAL